MKLPGIKEKVAFLRTPAAYAGRVQRVEIKETHMSCVFLTETQAWKLKKPVRTDYLDFSTIEARRRDCVREVRLNRRLAEDVYRGIVPLTVSKTGDLCLGGPGKPVDWLVSMRRLASNLLLDDLILRHAVTEEHVSKLAAVLVDFYKKARPIPMTGLQYRERLKADIEGARTELSRESYGLNSLLIDSLTGPLLKCLQERRELFDERTCSGHILEAHGDLRPEHICLEPHPVIIDCLEFNRNLRILDAASELSFLALECERLGAPAIGNSILKTYSENAGDRPSPELLAFYRTYHACIRAKIAIWHLKDDSIPYRASWVAKANKYLALVTGVPKAA
jgi:uncharacterized protein